METRANYIVVGIFTIVAVLSAFAFVYWTAAIGDRGETAVLHIRIPGSASGLGPGSAVLFNGVKVGSIRRVYLDVDKPTEALADAVIDRLTPITRSTRADIGIAGLTGQANVELTGASPDEPNLLVEAQERGVVAEIAANPSAVTNLLVTAQDIFTRTNTVLTDLEGFVQEVRSPLARTIENAEMFSQALAKNSDGIEQFLDSVSKLSVELAGVSGKLDGTLQAAEKLLTAVDADKVGTIVANIEEFSTSLKRNGAELDDLMRGVETTVNSINEFAQGVNQTVTRVDGLLNSMDPETVKTVLADVGEASKGARQVVDDVSKVTARFGERADDIDQILTDAREISSRLNQASARVDGVLVKVESLLGSDEAGGLMAEAGATLKEFRGVAETLNARIGAITAGLERFSGQGLRNVEALVGESRRAVGRIEEAISSLERNPQRILSGGEGTVREHDGRLRR